MEREAYITDGNLQIAEQHLRGINEKLFHANNSLQEKEEGHEELVKELVDVKLKTHLAKEEYKSMERKYVNFQVDKAFRIDLVNQSEVINADEDNQENVRRELEELKRDVEKFQEYREFIIHSFK